MKIKVNAKVNLALDVLGVRADGYHILDMIMASVSIGDIMECYPSNDIKVVMDGKICGSENIAYRTIEACRNVGLISGMNVNITKGIPISSGMGGSSCDSAGTLYAAAKLFNAPYDKLMEIANKLGSDVAFLYSGGVARVGGKGEIIEPMPYKPVYLVIGMGRYGALTSSVFREYDKSGAKPTNYAQELAELWDRKDIAKVGNSLTDAAIMVNEEISNTIAVLSKHSDKVTMSGSGAGVFAIFKDKISAIDCLEKVKNQLYFASYAELVPKGIEDLD